MTQQIDLNAPWSLHFDRDGTEDFGIICDAEMNDLVASHLPCTRIAERTFGAGTFWLPESSDDVMPQRVCQMRLMTAAPKLLEVLTELLRQIDEDIATDITTKHFASAVDDAVAAIAEATGRAA
ncbi:MAG: hypothetical protein ACJ8FY_05490 [Gemmataceae bacterium]